MSTETMHYRVTIPEKYGPGCPGYTKVSARQGHYTDAESPTDAARIIRARLPDDEQNIRIFDVQTWRPMLRAE